MIAITSAPARRGDLSRWTAGLGALLIVVILGSTVAAQDATPASEDAPPESVVEHRVSESLPEEMPAQPAGIGPAATDGEVHVAPRPTPSATPTRERSNPERPAPTRATPTRTPEQPAVVDRDCRDFATWREAQEFFIAAGGPARDPHRLDRDRNGIACESLPGAPKS